MLDERATEEGRPSGGRYYAEHVRVGQGSQPSQGEHDPKRQLKCLRRPTLPE
jgi:hypothetical protein